MGRVDHYRPSPSADAWAPGREQILYEALCQKYGEPTATFELSP